MVENVILVSGGICDQTWIPSDGICRQAMADQSLVDLSKLFPLVVTLWKDNNKKRLAHRNIPVQFQIGLCHAYNGTLLSLRLTRHIRQTISCFPCEEPFDYAQDDEAISINYYQGYPELECFAIICIIR